MTIINKISSEASQRPHGSSIAGGMMDFALKVIRNTCEYLLVLLTILECNSLYLHYASREDSNERMFRYGIIGLALILLVLRLPEIKGQLKRVIKLTPYFAGLYAVMGIFLYFNVMRLTTLSASFITLFMIFMPVMCLLFYLDRLNGEPYRLLWKYCTIITVYALLTLLIYLWVSFFPSKMPMSTVYTHWSNTRDIRTYDNYLGLVTLGEEKLFSIGSIVFYKNIGVFTEPPMAMIPLVTALFAELFLKGKRSSVSKALLLTAAAALTGSTLGLMMLVLAWVLKVVEKAPEKLRKYLVIVLAVVGAASIAFLFFVKKHNDSGSFSVHIQDYILSFKAFLSSPIIGGGYYNDSCVTAFMSESRLETNPGLSNSVAVIAAQGGIILELICMTPFVLGMIRFFSKDKDARRESLFFIGMFALYVVTIFHYRFFLMMLMAFGYSLMPFRLKDSLSYNYSGVTEKKLRLWPYGIAAVTAVSIITLGNIWKWLFAVMKSKSLLLTQSSWNLVFFTALIIAVSAAVGVIVRSEEHIKPLIWALVAVIGAVITLPFSAYISSFGRTLCDILGKGSFGRLFVMGLYVLITSCFYVIVYSVLRFGQRRIFILLTAAGVAVPVLCFTAGNYLIGSKSSEETVKLENDTEVMTIAAESSSGKVYSDVLPLLYSESFDGVSNSSGSGNEFSQLDNISVLMSGNHQEMFDEGFWCTAVSGDRALYTNDESVKDALEEAGYTFYNHYPNKLKVNLSDLAAMNGLEVTEKGYIRLSDESTSVLHGPYITLEDGNYSVKFTVRKNSDVVSGAVCTLRVTASNGEDIIKTKTLDAEDFDGNSKTVTIRVKAEDLSNVEFLVYAYQPMTLKKITYQLNPGYDIVNIRDEYNRISRTEYYKKGHLITLKKGYCAVEKEYDRYGNTVVLRYYGEDGEMCSIKSGYAELHRTYNSSGKVILREYFGTDGEPVSCTSGYSKLEKEYATNGKVSVVRYLDVDGNPVCTRYGYAERRYEYGKRKKVTRISYYDENGELTENSSGVAEVICEYNDTWTKRLSKTKYDLEGNIVK